MESFSLIRKRHQSKTVQNADSPRVKDNPRGDENSDSTICSEVSPEIPRACDSFHSLGIASWLSITLQGLAITKPTVVQARCIPQILQGQYIMACSKTGSGKTATFALPMLQNLAKDPYGIYAIILTPTRELAFQIAEQIKAFGQGIRAQVSVLTGGMDMMKQALEISQKPHILVATPGRLADLIQSCFDLTQIQNPFASVKYFILDEVDRLLDDCFYPCLKVIIDCICSPHHQHRNLTHLPQLLLFSATFTSGCHSLLTCKSEHSLFSHWVNIKPISLIHCYDGNIDHASDITRGIVDSNELLWAQMVDNLDQRYLLVPTQVKDAYLVYLLKEIWLQDESPKTAKSKHTNQYRHSVIVFVNKCRTAELVKIVLKQCGLSIATLHSRQKQRDRLASLQKFKNNLVPILVTTDLSSRGLDIPHVQYVVNYDIPANPVDYIHRVGRTARAGRKGLALSMVGERDIDLIQSIEQKMDKKLQLFHEIPSDEEPILKMLNKIMKIKRLGEIQLDENGFGERERLNNNKK